MAILGNPLLPGRKSDLPLYDGRVQLHVELEAGSTVYTTYRQTEGKIAVNWGDGSRSATFEPGLYVSAGVLGGCTASHSYADAGKYIISLDAVDAAPLALGGNYYDSSSATQSSLIAAVTATVTSGAVYRVVMVEGVEMKSNAFNMMSAVEEYDFTQYSAVPPLPDSTVFKNIPADCKILVPAALYDAWTAAAYWTNLAAQIVAV